MAKKGAISGLCLWLQTLRYACGIPNTPDYRRMRIFQVSYLQRVGHLSLPLPSTFKPSTAMVPARPRLRRHVAQDVMRSMRRTIPPSISARASASSTRRRRWGRVWKPRDLESGGRWEAHRPSLGIESGKRPGL